MRVRRVPHTTAYADTTVRPGPGALPRPPHPRHRRPRRCPPAALPATALAAADRSYGQTEPAAGGDDRSYGQDKSAGADEDDRSYGPGAIPRACCKRPTRMSCMESPVAPAAADLGLAGEMGSPCNDLCSIGARGLTGCSCAV